MHKLRYVEVEAWIVNEYHYVGLPCYDVLLTPFYIPKDGGQMHQHRNEPHVGQLPIVFH